MEGLFGAIVFGKLQGRIHTFEDISRKYTGRFGSHMVHLRKPLLEWAGNDLVEIEIKIALNAAWCGDPLALLAQWHFFHENALAAPLIIGTKPMGPGLSMFVITDIAEAHKRWLKGGKLLAVDFTVTFKEYIPFTEGLLSQFGLPGFNTGMPAIGGLPSLGAGAI
jgi:phage protein U